MTISTSLDRFTRRNVIESTDVIDLRHHFRTLLRFRYGILSLGLLCGTVALLLMLRANSVYQSSATLLIESNRPNITSIRDIYGLENQTREYFSTQFELLKGRNLAERVIEELDLLAHPDFAAPEPGERSSWRRFISNAIPGVEAAASAPDEQARMLAWTLGEFAERLTVAPVRNTDLVKIIFESTDPALAAAVANSLSNAYIESYLEQRLLSTQKASTWMSERLASLKATLDASEARMQDFLESENLVDIQGVAALNIQELDELTTQHNEARRARAEAETAFLQTQQLQDASNADLMRIPAVLNHPVIARVSDTMNSLEQQRAELSKRYGRNHPRMIALDAQASEAERNLALQMRQVLAAMETDYRNALNNERVTLERLDAAKADYQDVNRKRYEFRELEREVDTNRQLYDMFFTRIRETDETDGFVATNALIVDPAVPALDPSKPRRTLVVLFGLCGGLLLGAALAFLREMLDNTIHSPADVEERLGGTTLGIVPFGKGGASTYKGEKRAYLGFLEDTHSAFAESFRTLRTGVMLSSIDTPYKVIGITSSIPNEGKTTVSVNLALVLGQLKKTLLIDADLRRPALAKGLGLPAGAAGLSNYIAGTATLEECIHSFHDGAIAVIPGGQIAPNPLELLASSRFSELLQLLAGSYDQIILDTPPTQAVSDALVIGTLADAMVYVVKADATPINTIKAGLSRLRQANDNVMGIVLNQVNADKHASYYDYGGYYDSYGYSGKTPTPVSA